MSDPCFIETNAVRVRHLNKTLATKAYSERFFEVLGSALHFSARHTCPRVLGFELACVLAIIRGFFPKAKVPRSTGRLPVEATWTSSSLLFVSLIFVWV